MTRRPLWAKPRFMEMRRHPLAVPAKRAGLIVLCLAVAACSRGAPNLMRIERTQTTPDEFAILPGKPIEIPDDLQALPPPPPLGGPNRTDPTPFADAAVALGGRASATQRDGQTPDGGLVQAASRYGVDGNVRADLAVEDLEFRRNNRGRLLERWVGRTLYFDVYSQSSLDQTEEQDRWRQSGRPSSAAPPLPDE